MPTLPNLPPISDAQAQVLLAVFAPYEGATQAETIAEYKSWYSRALLDEVKRRMRRQRAALVDKGVEADMASVQATLNPPPVTPPTV